MIKAAATGQWARILGDLAPQLWPALERPGRHVPCPCHGKEDGFRVFPNVALTGGGFCNAHGPFGDGFALLMWANGWTFSQALRAVSDWLGSPPASQPTEVQALTFDPRGTPEAIEKRRRSIGTCWAETVAADHQSAEPMRIYLQQRGLGGAPIPAALRFHPALPYWHDHQVIGRYPAMVAAVSDLDGELVTVHRTYLTPDGQKAPVPEPRKLMSPSQQGLTSGCAVELHEAGPELAVAEGIETALAFHRLSDLPVWAAVTAGGMETIKIPLSVRLVVVAADHDVSGRGQQAANVLAKRIVVDRRRARIVLPPKAGTDWNDVLLGGIDCA